MSRHRICALSMIGLLALTAVVGCNVSAGTSPGGGTYVSVTILGRTFTFSFGDAGILDVRAGQTITQAAALRLFERPPAQAPPSGQMRMRSTDCGVARALSKESRRHADLPMYGSATVRFYVAAGTSADLCSSAILLSEYTLNLVAGVASIADDVYELSQEALQVIMANDVTLCIEVTADFDGKITFQEFSLSFGGGDGGVTASCQLENDDVENIHIMLPGEAFDASNRISPGGTRSATVEEVEVGDLITFHAGRNGVVLDTADCPRVALAQYAATVAWDGTQLTCSAEQGGGIPVGTEWTVPIDSAGRAVSRTAAYNGIDYAIVGVLNANTPDAPPASRPTSVTVNLRDLGLQYVERIYLAEACAWVPDVPNSLIGTVTSAYEEGGSPTVLELRLGGNTAEWSYERPEHITDYGGVAHGRAPILYSTTTTIDSDYEYDGHMFWTSFDGDTSRTLSSITLDIVDPASLTRAPNCPVPTWAGIAVNGITLVGPAGIPDGGGPPQPQPPPPPSGGTGTLRGQVVNALTGASVSGATVAVSGTALSTTTDAGGAFTLGNVPEGGQEVVVTTAGFVESSTAVVVLAGATTEVQVGLVPIGEAGDLVTIVLAWGATPSDLDLHLSGPDGAGGRFHAYFSWPSPVEHVFLDLDDTDSFGPETITIRPTAAGSFVAGAYRVWVHDYSLTPEFNASEARVTVTAGGAQIAQYSVSSGAGTSSDDIWQVVNLTVGADGSVTAVSVVQAFTTGSSSSVF